MSEEKPPEEKTPFEIAQYFAKRSHEVEDEETQDFFHGLAMLASVLDEIEKDEKVQKANKETDNGS